MTGCRRRPVGCAGGEQIVHPFAIVSRHLRPCELRKSRSFSSIDAFSGEFDRLTASSSQSDRGRRVEPLTGPPGLPSQVAETMFISVRPTDIGNKVLTHTN